MTSQNNQLENLIVSPLMTEKIVGLEKEGKYTFRVRKSANKIMVRKAVESIYKVKVDKVNIVPIKAKTVMRRNGEGKKGKSGKKAIVTLKKGESLKR